MKLIDADELYTQFTDDNYMTAKATVRGAIKNAPTIEIVLCMDCKRQHDCKFAQWQGNYGYCSNGEKGE